VTVRGNDLEMGRAATIHLRVGVEWGLAGAVLVASSPHFQLSNR